MKLLFYFVAMTFLTSYYDLHVLEKNKKHEQKQQTKKKMKKQMKVDQSHH